MDPKQMTALERIEAARNVLDRLANLPEGGRIKCGLIWVLEDLLNGLNNDVLVMEDKIKVYEEAKNKPEIKMEVVPDEESADNDEETESEEG